jgi:hypothetical protein
MMLAGGAAAGIAVTPVPWKLLDDSAIWTQNWSWTPRVPRGEVTTRFTTCTLCPAGCAVRARCIGGRPFALAGAAGDTLCPSGLCAHQAVWLPKPKPAGNANLQGLGPSSAILDMRPGRTASRIYRSLAASYYTPPLAEGATREAMCRLARQSVRFDLSRVKTLVSIGTPVLESWGSPARMWRRKREGMRVVQVEPRASRTALMADEWIAVAPGRELEYLLEELRIDAPALVIADGIGLPQAVVNAAAALNFRLGGEAVKASREPFVETRSIAEAPDRSIDLLLVDEGSAASTVPWPLMRSKLRAGAAVVAMTSVSHGIARHANHIVPAPAYLETFDDAPPASDSPVESFRIATPLLPAAKDAIVPVEFAARVAGLEVSLEAELKKRAEEIQKTGRGELLAYSSGERKPARGEDVWAALAGGAVWLDEPAAAPRWSVIPNPIAQPAAEIDERFPLALLPLEWRGDPALPMLRKLDHESDLRPRHGEALVHPYTAAKYRLTGAREARVVTACGACRLRLRVDTAVPPGTIEAACGPNLADLCDSGAITRARIETV